jgi:UDP-3-O-[3-hydroxymyristoyl] glucosamine N-acyltransferase
MKLAAIAKALSGELSGDADLEIRRIVHPGDATGSHDLALALTSEAVAALDDCRAGAAVVSDPDTKPPEGFSLIRYDGHERIAVAILTSMYDRGPVRTAGAHATASVSDDSVLGADVSVGANAVIGSRSTVGDRSIVLPNVTIGADVEIGADCVIHPGTVIGDRVEIGDRVIIHGNAVIGADGFSFIPAMRGKAPDGADQPPIRIHSLGTVVIEDDVEIGAGVTIDRATLRQTRIGKATKIDNQVQIAHNTVIGQSCLICGMVGIAGSATIGDRVTLAAGTGISDHVTVGSDVTVAPMAGVASNIASDTVVGGIPAVPVDKMLERLANVGRLKMYFSRVTDLVKRVAALETVAAGNSDDEQSEMTGGDHGRRG